MKQEYEDEDKVIPSDLAMLCIGFALGFLAAWIIWG
jgi:hypothetical protein